MHSETEKETENRNSAFTNQNITEKLFDMMDKFAWRLSQMETEFRTKQQQNLQQQNLQQQNLKNLTKWTTYEQSVLTNKFNILKASVKNDKF